jgi:hypothetical protein
MTTIDFQQLMKDAGEGFQPVPTGPYNAEVAKAEAVMSSTNKPMIKVQLRIIGGPNEGRLLFDQFVITAGNPNALSFFFEHMAAFGLDRAWFAQNPPLETVAATLMGRQVMVAVGIKQFKGADRNEVQSYKPITGGQIGGMTPANPGFGPSAVPPQAAPPQAAPVAPAPVAPAPVPVAPVAPAPAPVAPAPVAPIVVTPPPAAVPPPVAAPIPPSPVAAPAPVAAPLPTAPAPAPAPVAEPLQVATVPEPAVAAPIPTVAPTPMPAAPEPAVAVAPAPAVYATTDEEPF